MKKDIFRLKKIKIHNFKNFKDLDMDLDKFNVVVGPNASGKTNLTQIFIFLKDIVTKGLEDAIARQGGNHYICNLSYNDKILRIEFDFTSDSFHEISKVYPRGSSLNRMYANNVI